MEEHRLRPHQTALRNHRVSLPGHWYAITKCTASRRPLLVPDPRSPAAGAAGAGILVGALRWMHTQGRLTCHGYVVMTDHFHLLIALGGGQTLASCMQSLCGFTARRMSAEMRVDPPIWQAGYHDRTIRDERELLAQWTYIRNNPVRKGYVIEPDEWPFQAIQPSWLANAT